MPLRSRVHLINPSDHSFGVAVITPRWLYVLAAATGTKWGDPHLVDETLDQVDLTDHPSRRRRRHRHPHRQCAARLRDRPPGARARRVGRLRRHSRHAVPGGSARPGRGARGRARRRRPGVAEGGRGLLCRDAAADLRGRTDRRRTVPVGAVGSAAQGPLHVGVGADRARLPEALLVLFGLADRRPGAAAARGQSRRARSRRTAAPRVPLHRPRGRQFLSGHLRRSRAGAPPDQSGAAAGTRGAARRALRTDGAAGAAAGRPRVLHADHDGSRRGSGVPGRDAPGAHPRRAGRRRVGDRRPVSRTSTRGSISPATRWSRGSARSAATASTCSARSSSGCRATTSTPSTPRSRSPKEADLDVRAVRPAHAVPRHGRLRQVGGPGCQQGADRRRRSGDDRTG